MLAENRVAEGEFVPGGHGREWCDTDVLRKLKQRSLAAVRQQVEPVETNQWARFLGRWQGLDAPRRGLDAVLDSIELLQGTPLPASEWEASVLPSRVRDYAPGQLDELCAAGEIVWRGIEATGSHDGRITFYLADAAAHLAPPATAVDPEDELAAQILELLKQQGALFFDRIVTMTQGFGPEVLAALWQLVWSGSVTNDSLACVRSLTRAGRKSKSSGKGRRNQRMARGGFRSRRATRLPGSEGRWTATDDAFGERSTPTEQRTAVATQLLQRYGIVTRETIAREGLTGGFSGLYPSTARWKKRVVRGAVTSWPVKARRNSRYPEPMIGCVMMMIEPSYRRQAGLPSRIFSRPSIPPIPTAPPCPGPTKPFPTTGEEAARPQRVAGARVVIVDGELLGYLNRSGKRLLTFLPSERTLRDQALRALGQALATWSDAGNQIYLHEIDADRAGVSPLVPALNDFGFLAFGDQVQRRPVASSK